MSTPTPTAHIREGVQEIYDRMREPLLGLSSLLHLCASANMNAEMRHIEAALRFVAETVDRILEQTEALDPRWRAAPGHSEETDA